MAKITTITNPLTGQPAQVDQLEHTAQEIDDAIARALPGGAIDITLQNNDPRQWGIGSATGTFITDGNDALLGGEYYWGDSKTNLPFKWGSMRVDPRSTGSSVQSLMQTAYSEGFPGCVAQRKVIDGVFKPWEWVNPPMLIGVEYRTTERYLDKPVYVMAVDFGAMPNSTIKIVTFGDSTTRVISAHGIMNGGYVIPGCTGSGSYPAQEMQIFTEDGGKVGIMTHVDRSGYTAVVTVKYWKTTD